MATRYDWHKIAGDAGALAFAPNNMALVTVNGRLVTIARYRETLFAFPGKCPHAGALLAEGRMDAAGNVICPLHGYRFNITNGRNTSGEGYYLKRWPVEHRPDGIYVGLETTNTSE